MGGAVTAYKKPKVLFGEAKSEALGFWFHRQKYLDSSVFIKVKKL
jgi:hypothetical protein